MKISIIIPVYNTDSSYLRASLNSCLRQTIADEIEVIAVNDGSTNDAGELLKEMAESHPSLKVINQENMGTSVARNAGIEAAAGDYIMFVDADDWIEEDACEKVLREAYKSNADITFFGYATNREINRVLEKVPEGVFEKERLEIAILKGDSALGPVEVGTPWGKLIRAAVIRDKKVRYTPGLKKGQDTVFILNLIENSASFYYYAYLGYHYRMLGSSISHRYNPEIIGIMEATLKAYGDFVKNYNKGGIFKEAVRRKYYRILLGEYLMLDFCHPDNKTERSRRICEFNALTEKEPYRNIIEKITVKGFYDSLQLMLLKNKKTGILFSLKGLEIAVRNILIHQFGR